MLRRPPREFRGCRGLFQGVNGPNLGWGSQTRCEKYIPWKYLSEKNVSLYNTLYIVFMYSYSFKHWISLFVNCVVAYEPCELLQQRGNVWKAPRNGHLLPSVSFFVYVKNIPHNVGVRKCLRVGVEVCEVEEWPYSKCRSWISGCEIVKSSKRVTKAKSTSWIIYFEESFARKDFPNAFICNSVHVHIEYQQCLWELAKYCVRRLQNKAKEILLMLTY